MVRIGISVEGLTEEQFVKQVLFPHFINRKICVTPIQVRGNVSVERLGKELVRLARSFNYVTTFYDFYGFKRKAENETKASLEVKISQSIKTAYRDKLIPYIQMYEFEGLLFSSPGTIASVLRDGELEHWAECVLGEFNNNPETINNSSDTAPSKRLIKHTSYKKSIHGPAIAAQIGLDRLRQMCTGLDVWIRTLENLDHVPGQ